MDKEPLLPTINPRRKPSFLSASPVSNLCPLPEDDAVLDDLLPFSPRTPTAVPSTPTSSSFKERLIFGPPNADAAIPSPPPSPPPSPCRPQPPNSSSAAAYESSPWDLGNEAASRNWYIHDDLSSRHPFHQPKGTNLHRSRTAPAMSAINEVPSSHPEVSRPSFSPNHVIRQAFIFLSLYLTFGVLVYTLAHEQFKSNETWAVVDALYFSIVTMCTIGYGDITPKTTSAKLFSVAFVLVGFGFIDILLSAMVCYVLDVQERLLLATVKAGKRDARNYLVDVKKGRMRIRLKVGLALGVVVLCVGVGTGVLHFVERLGWLDSFYLSVMSVTTVGYGDRAFKSLPGRLFASMWLLVSTLAVARAFLFLAEARIDKRHRMLANWVLRKDMTVAEFLAADIDHNGFVSKSEFVIYKLKEMGKISEKDIAPICSQFERLDPGNYGKITLTDLLENHH